MRLVGGTHLRVGHGWSLAHYREAFQLREHVATCSHGLSERYREGATSRVGRKKFAQPAGRSSPAGATHALWRSLGALRADLVDELHPTRNGSVDPNAVALGSHRKLWWRCGTCGHAWQATVTNRTNRRRPRYRLPRVLAPAPNPTLNTLAGVAHEHTGCVAADFVTVSD